jgi:chromosome segregation ATPase
MFEEDHDILRGWCVTDDGPWRRMEYEAKLGNVDIKLTDAMSEKVQQLRAFEETKTQLEEDADREIDKLKEKYEAMLRVEHDIGLRLKGENGIMRKKFNALKRDIKSQEDDIAALNEQKANLNLTIQNLENEMGSLRKEIAARDETIGDKERRIVDMKKKTMELEKFKFILDFKVAELRKQIEPKERDVVTMREQLQSMGDELQRCARLGQAKGLGYRAKLRSGLRSVLPRAAVRRPYVHSLHSLVGSVSPASVQRA